MMKRHLLAVSFVIGLLLGITATAFTPSTNGKGIKWVSESSAGWSGPFKKNAQGAKLHLAGAFDKSLDVTNHAGMKAHLGLLDPIPSTPCTPQFDLTGDHWINAADLMLLLKDIHTGNTRSDFNCDGRIDQLDLYCWCQKWKSTLP